MSHSLRHWQRTAAAALADHPADAFLASATPAAGKTTFGLHVARTMLDQGRVRRVVVAAPTTHIARQWAAAAARMRLDLEPNRPNASGPEPRDPNGIAVTYQTIAAGPKTHARATRERPTLLIADEPHHMGDDAAWGIRARQAFDGAVFRLLLSGTPFRSDNAPIPWVSYDEDGLSRADYTYGYAQALRDEVCRPIAFVPYDGEMEWVSGGRRRRADFDTVLPHAESARRLRTALDPDGDWMAQVLRDADQKLDEVRRDGQPEAGGLVVATDMEHARAIATRLGRICGEEPDVVTSDDPQAGARIAAFATARRRWLVSVLMVSEGVDIPRLRVGVYATTARTELFFRQVVGRFVRRTPTPKRQLSWLLLPADPKLKELAAQIEQEREHSLTLEPSGADEPPEPVERSASGDTFLALSSSAELEDTILTETALQLFATDPEPHAAFAAFANGAGEAPQAEAGFAARERLRDDRAALVARVSRRTGEAHRTIHARVNRSTGAPSVADATIEQLERGNALLAKEAAR